MSVSSKSFGMVVTCLVTLLIGCSEWDTRYGETRGRSAGQSINGMGAFRSGLSSVESVLLSDVARLSSRTHKQDAIIWVPQSWPPANLLEATQWLQSYLQLGAKTIVFVVPDAGSTQAYWELASRLAPAKDRLEYRRQRARAINVRLAEDLQRRDIAVADWFVAKSLPRRYWIDTKRGIEYQLAPSDATGGQVWDVRVGHNVPTPGAVADMPLMVEITDPSWSTSRVIVIAGGALITNFAMTDPMARELVGNLNERLHKVHPRAEADRMRLAFLASTEEPIPLAKRPTGLPAATGMELLTTWPLSVITLHGVLAGIVFCLMMFPIFGRPRRVSYNRPTRFGNHLDAMAVLMRNFRDRDDAHQRVSRYVRHVRGETYGPWVPSESASDPNSDEATPSEKSS